MCFVAARRTATKQTVLNALAKRYKSWGRAECVSNSYFFVKLAKS
jgi:hypothetical protein